jgi:hypothetical protein
MTAPLLAALPYMEAVDTARKATRLPRLDRERLVCYLVCYGGLADRLLNELIARQPELVATALMDRGRPQGSVEAAPDETPGSGPDAPAEPTAEYLYTWDPDGVPALELVP